MNKNQQQKLIEIQSQHNVPKCFGKEWNNKSNMCKACFCFKDCGDFIRDFGYIKNNLPGHPKIINKEYDRYKDVNGEIYNVR